MPCNKTGCIIIKLVLTVTDNSLGAHQSALITIFSNECLTFCRKLERSKRISFLICETAFWDINIFLSLAVSFSPVTDLFLIPFLCMLLFQHVMRFRFDCVFLPNTCMLFGMYSAVVVYWRTAHQTEMFSFFLCHAIIIFRLTYWNLNRQLFISIFLCCLSTQRLERDHIVGKSQQHEDDLWRRRRIFVLL